MLDREELAWAGGFYSGEGSTGCYRACDRSSGGHVYSLSLQVCQVGREPLDRFQKSIGNLGKIRGPYVNKTKSRPNNNDRYLWDCKSFNDCQAIIAMLWPWLTSQKQDQASKALTKMREYHETLNR